MKGNVETAIREFTEDYDIIRTFVLVFDLKGTIRNINEKGCEILGIKKKDAIGKDWFENFLSPDYQKQYKKLFIEAFTISKKLDESFENPVLCKNGTERIILWHPSFVKDETGEIIGLLCSGEDVTAQRVGEKKLKESEENYRTLVDNIYQVAYSVDFNGDIRKVYPKIYPTFSNKRVKEFCGYTNEEFQNGSIVYLEQIHPEERDKVAALFFKMLDTKKTVNRTYRFRHKDGQYKWFEDTLIPKLDDKNNVAGFFGVIYEITKTVEQLKRIKEYEQFFSLSSDMFCIADVEGNLLKVNPGFQRALGYTEEELVSRHFLEFVHPDDKVISDNVKNKFMEGAPIVNFENRYLTKGGQYRWISWTAEPSLTSSNLYATGRDITEQKNALSTIQDYETFFNMSQDMFCIAGTDGFFKKINPSFTRVLGYTEKELLSKPFVDFVHPEDKDKTLKELTKLSEGGITINFDNRYKCKDGSYKWVSWTSSPAVDTQLVYAVARDISEQKKNVEKLRTSEEFLNSVVENIPNMIFVKDAKQLKFVQFNKAGEDLLGLKREEMIGRSDYDFFQKAEADFFTTKDRQVLKSRRLLDIAEEEIMTKNNGKRILHTKKIPLYDEQGTPEFLMGISEDITEAKQDREALRKSEEKYREIVHLIHEGIWIIDRQNITTFVNEEMGNMLGYRTNQIIGKSLYDFMDMEGKEVTKANTKRRKKGIAEQHDFKFKTKDGNDLWTILNSRPITDLNGKYIGAIAAVVDVTERKRSEQLIRENEQKLIEAQKIARVGSWEFNVETNAINWSDETYQLFGLDPKKGKVNMEKFRKYIHPDDRDILAHNVENAMRKGIPFEMEMRVVWPNKSVHHLIGRGQTIKVKNKIIKLIGTGMDITERKAAEVREMNALVRGQDSERRRIAEDLHDSLGQQLSAIKMFVESNCRIGTKKALDNAEALGSMLNETITEVRNISHNLMPAGLEDFGLTNTLEELCKKNSKKNGTQVKFQSYDVKPRIDKSIKFGIYRIAQELLYNALKHAKAKEINIQLFQRENTLVLIVEDDGKGFNLQKTNFDKTLGLNSITSRAKALNGQFNIDTQRSKGTIASVEIPLKK